MSLAVGHCPLFVGQISTMGFTAFQVTVHINDTQDVWLVLNLGGSSNGQKGRNNLSDVLFSLSAPSAPQPRPSRLIRAATRSSKVHEWRCCDREGGVLDRERGNKVVDHWRS